MIICLFIIILYICKYSECILFLKLCVTINSYIRLKYYILHMSKDKLSASIIICINNILAGLTIVSAALHCHFSVVVLKEYVKVPKLNKNGAVIESAWIKKAKKK